MTKPELSYNLIQVCRDVGDHMEVFHCITNEYNETIREYAEDESENAYKTWWMYLTEEEQELWKDYELECKAAAEFAEEDLLSRINRC